MKQISDVEEKTVRVVINTVDRCPDSKKPAVERDEGGGVTDSISQLIRRSWTKEL
jgi:hypothetical protein